MQKYVKLTTSVPCFSLPTGSQSNREFSTRFILCVYTLCYKVSRALLRLISVTVFNFAHPPVLSVLHLILSVSRFLVPECPLLVTVGHWTAPFLCWLPAHYKWVLKPVRVHYNSESDWFVVFKQSFASAELTHCRSVNIEMCLLVTDFWVGCVYSWLFCNVT